MKKFKVGFEEGSHIILNYLQSFVDVESNWYFEAVTSSLDRSYYLVMPGDEARRKKPLKISFSERSCHDLLTSALMQQGYWVQYVQMKQNEKTGALCYEVKGAATYESRGKVKRIR